MAFLEGALSPEVSEIGWRMNRNRAGVITPVLNCEVRQTPQQETIPHCGKSADLLALSGEGILPHGGDR